MAYLRGGTMIGGSVVITASNLLQAILRIDGSGSGIDSDFLDGHDSTYFSPYDHNHDDRYLRLTGGTMKGVINIPSGSNTKVAIKLGDAFLTSSDGAITMTNVAQGIRFSDSSDWAYNKWAGIRYISNDKSLIIGGPYGDKFTSNINPEQVNIFMNGSNAGVNTVYMNHLRMDGMIFTQTNGTGIQIGDDAQIGDCNMANRINIFGVETPADGGIEFGSGKDANIYRKGDNRLQTDSTFNAAGGYQWDGQDLDDRYVNQAGDANIGKLSFKDTGSADEGAIEIAGPNQPSAIGQSDPSFRGIKIKHNFAGTVMIGSRRGGSYDSYFMVKATDPAQNLTKIIEAGTDGTFKYKDNKIWHSGNDGWGSGLDADLFDGRDSEVYIFGDNATGTKEISDLNKVWKSGFYNTNTPNSTTPTNLPWHWVLNVGHVSNHLGYNYGFQVANPVNDNRFFVRTKTETNPGPWGRLYSTIDKPTPEEIGALATSGGKMTGDINIESSNPDVSNAIVIKCTKPSGGWAQGIAYINKDGKETGGIGQYATNGTATYMYIGMGDNFWQGENSLKVGAGIFEYNHFKVWHAGNDGSGSGLDADTVDGYNSTDFVIKSGDTMTGQLTMHNANINFDTEGSAVTWNYNTDYAKIYFKDDSDGDTTAALTFETGDNGDEGFLFKTNTKNLLRMNSTAITADVPIYNAVYNDYAEYFEKGEEVEAGELVMLDDSVEEEKYIKSNKAYSNLVVGICSDEYAQCIGGERGEDNSKTFIAVGLAGRLRVKIIGKAKKGDLITSSDIPGVGMVAKEYKPGTIIGKCLENKDTEDIERVRVLIQNM